MEGQSKRSRGLEAYCKGGQGPRRAVAPSKKKNKKKVAALVKMPNVKHDILKFTAFGIGNLIRFVTLISNVFKRKPMCGRIIQNQ